ncbi:MAG: hypothetical protein U9N59_03165 [Campylobacterota bacterium]|nr:hypothetical protein [Campylobacterota bacterium]
MQDITNPLFGSIRFFLTPIPFMMDDEYMFLFFSSFFHWYSLPFTIIGGYFIYKENKKYAIFLFSFMLIILFFYGLYAELQGPRHRLLILPYISLLQFAGYMVVFRKLFAKPFYKE